MPLQFVSDSIQLEALYPFSLTRSPEEFWMAGDRLKDHWVKAMNHFGIELQKFNWQIGANVFPTMDLVLAMASLGEGNAYCDEAGTFLVGLPTPSGSLTNKVRFQNAICINRPWHLWQYQDQAIREAWHWYDKSNGKMAPLSVVVEGRNCYIHQDAKVSHTIINTLTGPVYIDAGAEVMEGCTLRGPLRIGRGAVVKMGTRIYGATSIGEGAVAGGEIKNSIISPHSNKAHDGYLGDAVVGEWCNLGAGTSCSNLANNAGDISMHGPWGQEKIGQKCGLIMGDYSRSAIHTAFNTGTVVGVCANVFGAGLTPRTIPSFAWGQNGDKIYRLEKALQDVQRWKALKGAQLSSEEIVTLTRIFERNETV